MSPNTAILRPATTCSAKKSRAAKAAAGLLLKVSSSSVAPATAGSTFRRPGSHGSLARALTMSGVGIPSSAPTASAASAAKTRARPSHGIQTRTRSPASTTLNRVPTRVLSTSTARRSAPSWRPTVATLAELCSAMARTRASSQLSTASPSVGSASTSAPFSRATWSSEPRTSRWASLTAVTTPIDGRVTSASAAISPKWSLPNSITASSSSGRSEPSAIGRPNRPL